MNLRRRTTTLRQIAQLLSTSPVSTPIPHGSTSLPAFQTLSETGPLSPHAFRVVYYDPTRNLWKGKEVGRGVTRCDKDEGRDLLNSTKKESDKGKGKEREKERDDKVKEEGVGMKSSDDKLDSDRTDVDEEMEPEISSPPPVSKDQDSNLKSNPSARRPNRRERTNPNEYDPHSNDKTLDDMGFRDGDVLDCVVLLPVLPSIIQPQGSSGFSVRGTAGQVNKGDFGNVPSGPSGDWNPSERDSLEGEHPWGPGGNPHHHTKIFGSLRGSDRLGDRGGDRFDRGGRGGRRGFNYRGGGMGMGRNADSGWGNRGGGMRGVERDGGGRNQWGRKGRDEDSRNEFRDERERGDGKRRERSRSRSRSGDRGEDRKKDRHSEVDRDRAQRRERDREDRKERIRKESRSRSPL